MGIIKKTKSINRNRSGSTSSHEGHLPNVKLTKEDVHHYKSSTADVHDPILSAVQDAQPFEDSGDYGNATNNAYRKSYLSQMNQYDPSQQDPNGDNFDAQSHNSSAIKNGKLVDVFGQPINIPDVSNPTRERDENGNYLPQENNGAYTHVEEQGVYVAPQKQQIEQKKKRGFFGKKKKQVDA